MQASKIAEMLPDKGEEISYKNVERNETTTLDNVIEFLTNGDDESEATYVLKTVSVKL